jgi:vacuolar-type H+-ATPase subunit E/Vma4
MTTQEGYSLCDKILDDANAEAGRIIEEASLQASEEIRKAEAKAENENAVIIEKFKIELVRRRGEGMEETMLKKRLGYYTVEKELIDGLYSQVVSGFVSFNRTDSYREMLREAEKRVSEILSKPRIYLRREDAAVMPHAKERSMSGGLYAESGDGNVIMDYSFDTFLKNGEESSKKEILRRVRDAQKSQP